MSTLRVRAGAPHSTWVPALEVDSSTLAHVRFAAQAAGISESELVARAVTAYVDAKKAARDPWEPVPIFGEYADIDIHALYLPINKRVTITSGPLTGERFSSPSGAARSVVLAINPLRNASQTNGWRFWKLKASGERLEVLRDPPPRRRRRRKPPPETGEAT